MTKIEIFLINRKLQYEEKNEEAYDTEQYARTLLDSARCRKLAEKSVNDVVTEQAVNGALIAFIDELLDEFF